MPPTSERPPRRWTPTRAVVTVLVLAMVAMWGYVLYLAFGPGRQDPPDRLEDTTFAVAAQERCSEALDEVALLPRASDVGTAAERADVVEQANAVFASMIDDLGELAPPGEEGEVVAAWLDDWRLYLVDRAEYADALRADPQADLFVSARDNEQVTEYIDAFAADNKMISCGTPIDV